MRTSMSYKNFVESEWREFYARQVGSNWKLASFEPFLMLHPILKFAFFLFESCNEITPFLRNPVYINPAQKLH